MNPGSDVALHEGSWMQVRRLRVFTPQRSEHSTSSCKCDLITNKLIGTELFPWQRLSHNLILFGLISARCRAIKRSRGDFLRCLYTLLPPLLLDQQGLIPVMFCNQKFCKFSSRRFMCLWATRPTRQLQRVSPNKMTGQRQLLSRHKSDIFSLNVLISSRSWALHIWEQG